MKINFSQDAMDNLMSLCRYLNLPPQDIINELLKSIEFKEALSYVCKENKKEPKKE